MKRLINYNKGILNGKIFIVKRTIESNIDGKNEDVFVGEVDGEEFSLKHYTYFNYFYGSSELKEYATFIAAISQTVNPLVLRSIGKKFCPDIENKVMNPKSIQFIDSVKRIGTVNRGTGSNFYKYKVLIKY